MGEIEDLKKRNAKLQETAHALLTWVGFYARENDDFDYWTVREAARVLDDPRGFEEWQNEKPTLDARIATEVQRIGDELIAQSEKLKASHGKNQKFHWAIRALRQEGERIKNGRPPIHPTSQFMPDDVVSVINKRKTEPEGE